jgi:hypothetical protein
MKKVVSVLVIALFVVNSLHAQTTETLTNSTIIKMVKAKLSDDLIIDQINSSKVNFNVSTDSVKFLSDKNVSNKVIQVMKTASGTLILPVETAISSPKPVIVEMKDSLNLQATKEPALSVKVIPSTSATVQLIDT